jgi:hypothetical protein
MTCRGPSDIYLSPAIIMPEETIQDDGGTKEIEWDPACTRELSAPTEKRIGSAVNPASIALVLGTGVLLFFCQAFVKRLTERFGEDAANYLADRLRDLASKTGDPQLGGNLLSEGPRPGIGNLLSSITRRDKSPVRTLRAARTIEPVRESDSLVYSIVAVSIFRLTGRRRS